MFIGIFQVLTLVSYILAFTSGSFILYCFDYNMAKPSYLCEQNNGQFETCTVDYICDQLANQKEVNYVIDYSNPSSLDNWVEKLGLLCKFILFWLYSTNRSTKSINIGNIGIPDS